MALFKCKMCGGDLEIAEGVSIAECEYCGTKQTVPKSMDENLHNLFNRANTLRIKSEFDKAEKLYEKIIQADSTQSEAYWGLILCKYGIEYVDDPSTYKKIPTCHRASYDSIIADDDYKSALKNADMSQRAIYEEQAKEIDRIQKDILALAQKEETYDVFICYKETDANGQRTQDSVIANDIYYQLTNEGFKVFYAAITLEGKLGSAYEPIIFAALNSAKVMLAIGTKPEYYNAVWVKNEWSRFLNIIKKDRSKLLIPCYRDMDAYELPEEFSHLQAQDMAKIGFINDLVRGLKKVIKKDEPKQTVVKETVVKETVSAGAANTASLLKRAFMFLEDGDWESANEYCEKVLDIDPENAQAYLGKLMAELNVKKQDSLKDCTEPFENSNNYQKAIRFADDTLKSEVKSYIEYINTRNENVRLEAIYINAIDEMESATTKDEYYAIAEVFESISHYKDSALMAEKCINEANEADAKNAYLDAKHSIALYHEFGGTYHLEIAIEKLKKLGDYEDSPSLISKYEIALEEENKQAKIRAKRNKKIAIITTPIVCAIVAFIIVLNTVIIPNGKYNDAIALMGNGNYSMAILSFEALNGYRDSDNKIKECQTAILDIKYNEATILMDSGKYSDALIAFEALSDYRDSGNKIKECQTAILDIKYNKAIILMDSGNIVEAYETFVALNGYKNSVDKANSIYTKYKIEKLRDANIGDSFMFGKMEQDNVIDNGTEEIEWIVLDKKDDAVLVISKYCLEFFPYEATIGQKYDVTWKNSTARAWLNGDFYNDSFNSDEKSFIAATKISLENDYLFLLNVEETEKYFPTKSSRLAQYIFREQKSSYCTWALRSNGSYSSNPSDVSYTGEIRESGLNHEMNQGIRPALWIDLSK